MATRVLPNELSLERAQTSMQEKLKEFGGHFKSEIPQQKQALSSNFAEEKRTHNEQFDKVSSNIGSSLDSAKENFQKEAESSLYTRPLGMAKDEGLVHLKKLTKLLDSNMDLKSKLAAGFQITEEPFWMNKGGE